MTEILNFPAKATAAAAADDLVQDGSTATFMQQVMEESLRRPVLVQFHAAWCQPCKQLAPILEKLVRAAAGRVRLVRLDIDANPQLAAQLRVQSVPTVYAFFQGQPVDAFMGMQPESQVKVFVERLAKLGGANDSAPVDEAAQQIAVLHAALADGELAAVAEAMANLPDKVTTHKDYAALQAALKLAQQAASAGPLDALVQAVHAAPNNHAARYDLAVAQFAAGLAEEALANLLHIIAADKKWQDEQAYQQLLTIFEALGAEDARVRAARRQLSAILFK